MYKSRTWEDDLAVELTEDSLELLDKSLAGIFNGDFETSSKITAYILKILSMKELDGPYKVLYAIIQGMDDFKQSLIYKDNFDADLLTVILTRGIDALVKKYSREFNEWIQEKGFDYNLDSTKGIVDFTDFLFGETIRKYQDIMTCNPEQAERYAEALGNELRECAIGKMLLKIGSIVTIGDYVGKEFKRGGESALELSRSMEAYITEKYSFVTSRQRRYAITQLDSVESAAQFQQEEVANRGGKNNYFEVLYDCQFGLLNMKLMRGDILSFVGDEGVGKTKVLVEQVYYALRAGHNVLVICTETKKLVMLNMIYARHIYEETGLKISEAELLQFPQWIEEEEDPERRLEMENDYAVMQDAIASLYTNEKNGKLSLLQSTKYSEVGSVVEQYKNNYDGTIIAIDSISFLDGDNRSSEKENLDRLMKTVEDSANDLGMTFILTTHTSSNANQMSNRGNDNVGVRISAGSGHVTKISTLVIYIHTTEELRQQDRFIFSAKKTRFRESTTRDVIMLRHGAVNHYEYRDDIQASTLNIDDLSGEARFMDNI